MFEWYPGWCAIRIVGHGQAIVKPKRTNKFCIRVKCIDRLTRVHNRDVTVTKCLPNLQLLVSKPDQPIITHWYIIIDTKIRISLKLRWTNINKNIIHTQNLRNSELVRGLGTCLVCLPKSHYQLHEIIISVTWFTWFSINSILLNIFAIYFVIARWFELGSTCHTAPIPRYG